MLNRAFRNLMDAGELIGLNKNRYSMCSDGRADLLEP